MANTLSNNDEIENVTNTENVVDSDVIKMYKYTKRKIYGFIHEHEHEIKKLKKTLEKIDDVMYKKCSHDWERDPPQMYTLSSYTCKKCHLSK